MERCYIAIDLKSFYASVECVERGLDPLDTNLVVADISRTEKTICLAVSPSLKALGVSGRPRLFEVTQRLREVNRARGARAEVGRSTSAKDLKEHPEWTVDMIVAPPRMAYYIEYSTRIFKIYLNYVAPEDIHVYSVDEVFINATDYLKAAGLSGHDFAMTMIRDVLKQTGITATAGIGTNMYLAKIAMDIKAKKMQPDADGVRIASLDEMGYRHELWDHTPLTDFWRVGHGTQQRLAMYGIDTMGKIARMSVENEDFLYKLFGVNAELLIDHAWGWEPCTIAQVKAYRPQSNSISSGQVLQSPYSAKKALVVVREMAEAVALDLLDKGLVTDQVVLDVGYDTENLRGDGSDYDGAIVADRYGRLKPKHAHGTGNLGGYTMSARRITEAVVSIFERTVDQSFTIRRLNITANHLIAEADVPEADASPQLELFTDYEAVEQARAAAEEEDARERRLMETTLALKKRFGKNALLKGLDFDEGATARDRNNQIGGHKA